MEFLTVSFNLLVGQDDHDFSMLGELPENSFRGYATIFGGIIDSYCPTIIHPGAFTKTLQEKGRGVKLLWQHDDCEPIGLPTYLAEVAVGLAIQGKISTTTRGLDCLQLMRDKVVDALSIGFDSIKEDFIPNADGSMTRHIREIRLWEISAVTWGADPNARISEVHKRGNGKMLPAKIERSAALPFQNLPVAGLETAFSATDVKEWSGSGEKPSTKYSRAFAYCENPLEFDKYQYQIADVIDGELMVIPAALFSAAIALTKVNSPDEDNERVQFHLDRYFAKMRKQFSDETIVAPWDVEAHTGLGHYQEKDALYLLGHLLVNEKLSLADAQSALSLVSVAVPAIELHTSASEDLDQALLDAELAMNEMLLA